MSPRLAWSAVAGCLAAICSTGGAGAAGASLQEAANPLAGDPKAVEQGMHLYRGRCAVCHGLDAKGYRGPDLTAGATVDMTDAQLQRVISRGVPGTEMPGSTMHADELWMVVAYLRTLKGPASEADLRGNAEQGERLFWGKGACGDCHLIAGRGGRLGPDLTRIGAARSRAALVREIRTASELFRPGYEPVTVVTQGGERIVGCRKNEDTFSIQIMAPTEEVLSFWKKDLREVIEDTRSLMPDYGPDRLSDDELDDLVRYLSSLRGAEAPAEK